MTHARQLLTAALAVTVGGCVVGPRYATPPTPASGNGAFVSATNTAAANEPPPPGWWRLFNDPALDSLVQRALTENQDLKVAAANLAYAQAQVDEARAGHYPSTELSFGPSYGRSQTEAQAHLPATFEWAGGFVAAYQVDLFGRIRRTNQAARANAEALEATQDATRVTVAAETASAYASLCGFGRQIAVAKASLDVVQKTYDLTVLQRNAGVFSDFDVERQAVLLEQAKAAIPPLEGQRRASLFSLAALVGMTPKEFPAQIGACASPPKVATPLPVGDGAALLRRRPDLRAAERQLAAATYRIGVATADLYPTITLAGSVTSAASTISGLFNSNNVAYGIGSSSTTGSGAATPLITWAFPNTLVAQAHIKEARAQASGALATFESTVLTALKETETALSAYATEIDHNVALAAARARADEAFRMAQTQYRLGAFSFLDLLQAEATAVAADQALAASYQTLATDQVGVFQALGGGWEDAPAVVPPAIAGVTPKIRAKP
ncbi:MAG TPA: TolC family protein [Caulobacteraceae bacterium]|jgi:NodT family efflux transporter outer membrane factor (OMF) lipoprotein